MNHLTLCNNSVFLFVMRRRDVELSRRGAGRGKEGFQQTPLLTLTQPLPLPRLSGARQRDILIFGLLKAALCLICEADQSYQLTFQCSVFVENRRLNFLPLTYKHSFKSIHEQLQTPGEAYIYILHMLELCTLYSLIKPR